MWICVNALNFINRWRTVGTRGYVTVISEVIASLILNILSYFSSIFTEVNIHHQHPSKRQQTVCNDKNAEVLMIRKPTQCAGLPFALFIL